MSPPSTSSRTCRPRSRARSRTTRGKRSNTSRTGVSRASSTSDCTEPTRREIRSPSWPSSGSVDPRASSTSRFRATTSSPASFIRASSRARSIRICRQRRRIDGLLVGGAGRSRRRRCHPPSGSRIDLTRRRRRLDAERELAVEVLALQLAHLRCDPGHHTECLRLPEREQRPRAAEQRIGPDGDLHVERWPLVLRGRLLRFLGLLRLRGGLAGFPAFPAFPDLAGSAGFSLILTAASSAFTREAASGRSPFPVVARATPSSSSSTERNSSSKCSGFTASFPPADRVEQVLRPVRQLGERRESHRRRHALQASGPRGRGRPPAPSLPGHAPMPAAAGCTAADARDFRETKSAAYFARSMGLSPERAAPPRALVKAGTA